MPKGINLSSQMRLLISDHHFRLHRSPEQIYNELFQNNPGIVCLIYLRELISRLDNGTTNRYIFENCSPLRGKQRALRSMDGRRLDHEH